MKRSAELTRTTSETNIEIYLDLDGTGQIEVDTGLGFLNHMLDTLSRHGGFDLRVSATGDVAVDDHHTVEDCALLLARSLESAVGERSGIRRFGSAYAPLDEALARSVIDLSGRPWTEVHIPFNRDEIGGVATETIIHFFRTLALEGRMALHVDVLRGDNDHHMAEAAFKATALALREAVERRGESVPSTKGVLG
jgi:imidazoleglycerol phosphate dehydratase HisB